MSESGATGLPDQGQAALMQSSMLNLSVMTIRPMLNAPEGASALSGVDPPASL